MVLGSNHSPRDCLLANKKSPVKKLFFCCLFGLDDVTTMSQQKYFKAETKVFVTFFKTGKIKICHF